MWHHKSETETNPEIETETETNTESETETKHFLLFAAVSGAFRQMIPTLDVSEVKELKIEEAGEFGFVTCRSCIHGKNFK